MGSLLEFNWILKLSDKSIISLSIGTVYHFKKDGIRMYPIDVPIDLVNQNWEAIACCTISKIIITSNSTKGEYRVVEVYNDDKKAFLTEQWRKVLRHVTGDTDIADYRKKHIT